jgi:hypothetical protein
MENRRGTQEEHCHCSAARKRCCLPDWAAGVRPEHHHGRAAGPSAQRSWCDSAGTGQRYFRWDLQLTHQHEFARR